MLRELVATDVFKLLLVFVRVGMAIMLFPAFGGTLVNQRQRLFLGMAVSLAMVGPLLPQLPDQPKDPWDMAVIVLGEIVVGAFLGGVTQLLMTALDLAGSIIGYATGLTNALVSDPVTEQQSQLTVGLLTLTGATLLMVTDTEHGMFRALADSYLLFKPGEPLMLGDMSQTFTRVLADSFSIGARLGGPLLIFQMMFNITMGVLNRMTPQVQVFFVGMPVQVMGGLAVLAFAFPVIMMWFMSYFIQGLVPFIAPH